MCNIGWNRPAVFVKKMKIEKMRKNVYLILHLYEMLNNLTQNAYSEHKHQGMKNPI